ncbi:hypothetical protein DFH07DRAFT_974334 [Mycena maculata]|uniref:Uncharacterized protein n=1 Tax=Mycena maculata TaxID=230809 RepID=A0AAD7H8C3_9AGAR|nr:hypothetical protein DFH07DRAFT_974334 [Mycena maculata]
MSQLRKIAHISLAGETARNLSDWVLSIVAWTPPSDLSSVSSVLVQLYTERSEDNPSRSEDLYKDDQLQHGVNNAQIAPSAAPVVDISDFVVTGTNTLRVEAVSTLLNAINAVPELAPLGFSELRRALFQ